MTPYYHLRQPLTCGCLFSLLPLATRKRVHIFSNRQLICCIVLLQLILNIRCYHFAILSYCIHVVSFTPETSASIFVLQICMPIENHQRTLSLECAILMCGGILTTLFLLKTRCSLFCNVISFAASIGKEYPFPKMPCILLVGKFPQLSEIPFTTYNTTQRAFAEDLRGIFQKVFLVLLLRESFRNAKYERKEKRRNLRRSKTI